MEELTKEELIEQFKGNKILKYSTYTVGIIVAIVLGYLGYKELIYKPKENKSMIAIADGISLVEKDSITDAIDHLEMVASSYKGYKGGQIASYLLGNLYFEQGNYEDALAQLKRVKVDDTYIMTLAIGTQGDCYSELEDYPNAVKMYIKAAERQENEATSPLFYFKAGLNAEEAGDYVAAAKFYHIIKDKYPSFGAQKGIDKYIVRAENTEIK